MMDEDTTRDAAPDSPAVRETMPEGIMIEGLRPPLTRVQRLRRLTIASAAIACALLVAFWPAISSLATTLHPFQPVAQATATSSFSWQSTGRSFPVVVATGAFSSDVCITTPLITSNGWNELHAETVGNGDVWALLLSGPHIAAGHDINIVWRATGRGTFRVVAHFGPGGAQVMPVRGPDPHLGGSTWQRPGDEWGTIFNFPAPGCWQLDVTRGTDLTAIIRLFVGA